MAIKFMKNNAKELKPNIFMQETEPEIKEGIWVKANKQVDKIEIVESILDGEKGWASLPNLPVELGCDAYACIGDEVYVLDLYSDTIYKVNPKLNTCESLESRKRI